MPAADQIWQPVPKYGSSGDRRDYRGRLAALPACLRWLPDRGNNPQPLEDKELFTKLERRSGGTRSENRSGKESKTEAKN